MSARRFSRKRLLFVGGLLLIMKGCLTLFGYRRLRDFRKAKDLPLAPATIAGSIAMQVRIAARRVPGASCLVQALAVHQMLRWAGCASSIHIGVARLQADGRFEAHAWVKSGDLPVIGHEVPGFEDYARLFELC